MEHTCRVEDYLIVSTAPVEVTHIDEGPVLIRNARVVVDSDDTEHPVTRPLVALCACGFSQRKPWCDATHKVARN